MTSIYITSKGEEKLIADLPYPYLKSALAKLEREMPDRTGEIHAMRAEVMMRDADEAENPRAAIGGNMPPEPVEAPVAADPANPQAFAAITANLDDLLMEAKNWADGASVETQDQADAVGRLIGDLATGASAAEDLRVAEKKPLDDQIQAIQDRYNVYLAPLKNKKPGRVPVAIDALKRTVGAYMIAEQRKKDEIARLARIEAQRVADEAAAAMRAADAQNIEAREAAEVIVQQAAQLQRAATVASKASVAVDTGGARRITLRTDYRAEIADFYLALEHYIANNPEAFETLINDLARKDVAAGKRQIPGIRIIEEQKAA